MAGQVKKKLCWNCEGNVSNSQETCPYCGVYLSPQGLNEDPITTSPFKKSKAEEEIPAPPYQPEAIHNENGAEAQEAEENLLVPLAALMGGALLALFGLVIYFFSTNGRLTLSWDSDWGLIFLAVSLPLLYIGYRGALSIKQ